jgi:hypothetical protein
LENSDQRSDTIEQSEFIYRLNVLHSISMSMKKLPLAVVSCDKPYNIKAVLEFFKLTAVPTRLYG